MNSNIIKTDGFSNEDSEKLYHALWVNEPNVRRKYEKGFQCHFCRHFAALSNDWGLCCNARSRHSLETVFEHFTCPSFAVVEQDP